MSTKNICEGMIRESGFMRLGPSAFKQCHKEATVEVSVNSQGKMKLCDGCLPEFRKWATLPWTAKPLKVKP